MDDKWSEKLTWDFSSGVLKIMYKDKKFFLPLIRFFPQTLGDHFTEYFGVAFVLLLILCTGVQIWGFIL